MTKNKPIKNLVMKKQSILKSIVPVVLAAVIFSSCSEKVYVTNAINWAEQGIKLDTALKSVNAATELEKTKDWPKTYYAKGVVLSAINSSEVDEFKNLVEDPLLVAFDNFKKASKMDNAATMSGMIDAKLLTLSNQILQGAIDAWNNKEYTKAFNYFEKSLEVREMPLFNEAGVDTSLVYNTALSAKYARDYENAIKYFRMAAELDYENGDPFVLIKQCYFEMGDTAAGVKTLNDGFNKYPDNKNILYELVNHYVLIEDNPEKAFNYLELAKEKDPENPQIYTTLGHVNDKMGRIEKAIESYKKAIELDPANEIAYYNLGILYFNMAVDLDEAAIDIKDDNEYKEAKAMVNQKFKKALPYIEKAHNLKPEDKTIINTLKTIYYRLQMTDKYDEMIELLK